MLSELRISNFAIIEEQSVKFGPGLNVISGQTGSGKSIILNALELILGARPRANLIRHGAEELLIEGHFDLTSLPQEIFKSLPEIAQTEELVLSRSINQAGKGRVYINGRAGTASLLNEIAQKLINICGQGQHISLLEPRYHLELIDQYAGNEKLLKQYRSEYQRYKDLYQKRESYLAEKSLNDKRRFEMEEVVSELSPLGLHPALREELEDQIKKLENAEKLILGFQAVDSLLSSDEGIQAGLSALVTNLNQLSKYDTEIQELVDRAGNIRSLLQDLELDATRYSNKITLNSTELEELREKLSDLARLHRKYRTDDAGLMTILESAKHELSQGAFSDIKELELALNNSEKILGELAGQLSRSREKAGAKLVKLLEADLESLNMPDAKFRLEMEARELGPSGRDNLEILISANKGELFKPLKQIASGGELSRIMLVLKKNLKDRSGVNVLVFDEVDTGISGSVARAVGQKLKSLSEFSQVICITHLAQIASLSDRHILVDKLVKDRTVSVIKTIEGEDKINEIARMLSGFEITAASRKSAIELIKSSK